LLIRIFYDFEIRTDFPLFVEEKIYITTFALGVCFVPMISVLKSYKNIDFEKAINTIYYLYLLILSLILVTNINNLFSVTDRMDANIGLNTISLGHFGVTGFLMAIYFFKEKRKTGILLMSLSLFFVFAAASRGPLLALFIVIIFWYFSKSKNAAKKIFTLFILSFIVFLFQFYFLNLLSSIAPVLYNRFFNQPFDGVTGGRIPLYLDAINTFINNPFLGGKFAINLGGNTIYSHNLILDSLMGLGILGGAIIIYVMYQTIKVVLSFANTRYLIFYLILLQQIISLMTSSAIYLNPLINILWIIALVNFKSIKTLTRNS
jgi:hypothetical protein